MTSHIFLALGMWPDVERANIQARQAVERAAGRPAPGYSCGHGGLWLAYARLQEGLPIEAQVEECRQVAAKAMAGGNSPLVGYNDIATGGLAELIVRDGIEAGKWTQPSELPAGRLNYARFLYAYGDVLKSRGDGSKEAGALGRMRSAHAILTTDFRKEAPDDDQSMPWMDLMLAQAEAVPKLAAATRAEGIAALQAVAKRESELPPVFGPPVIFKPSWELLGDELLADGNKAGAAAAYRQSLKLQPGRRLSLAGLAKATR